MTDEEKDSEIIDVNGIEDSTKFIVFFVSSYLLAMCLGVVFAVSILFEFTPDTKPFAMMLLVLGICLIVSFAFSTFRVGSMIKKLAGR